MGLAKSFKIEKLLERFHELANKRLQSALTAIDAAELDEIETMLDEAEINGQLGQKAEDDMARNQRTPAEIDAEQEEQEEVTPDPEDDPDEEEETEEQEQEDEEDEENDAELAVADESAMLHEDYSAFLCLGYSPEQIDKHLPKLIADSKANRIAHTKDMAGAIGKELAQEVQDSYDQFFLPAFQEFMKAMRESHGNDLKKINSVVDWLTGRLLREHGRYHVAHLGGYPWPKPENG